MFLDHDFYSLAIAVQPPNLNQDQKKTMKLNVVKLRI